MSKNRLKVALSGIRIAPVVVAIAFATVNAQGPPGQIQNPFNAIVTTLDQVLAVLNQLNPQAGPNPVVLTTPWLSTASGDLVSCPILNGGTTTLTDVSSNISDTGGQNTGGFAFPTALLRVRPLTPERRSAHVDSPSDASSLLRADQRRRFGQIS